ALLIPCFLIVVFLSLFHIKQLLLFVIFCTPLSVSLEEFVMDFPINMFLPTEPILFGIMLLIILKQLKRGTYDKAILNHPLSLALLFYLAWLVISTITSSHPLVSFKFLLNKLWFIIPLFFFGITLYKNQKNMFLVQWLYIISLSIVVVITLVKH